MQKLAQLLKPLTQPLYWPGMLNHKPIVCFTLRNSETDFIDKTTNSYLHQTHHLKTKNLCVQNTTIEIPHSLINYLHPEYTWNQLDQLWTQAWTL